MLVITEAELGRQVRADGAPKTAAVLCEALRKGELKPSDFSLRDLACTLVVNKTDGKPVGMSFLQAAHAKVITEAAAQAVQSDAFAQINGQIFYNALLEGYMEAEPNVSAEFGVIPSTNLRGEKFAGISNMAVPLPTIPENQEYPSLQPSQDFVESCAQLKRGFKVELSTEALMMDRTGELLEKCRGGGKALAIDRELEACACLLDIPGIIVSGGALAVGTGNARTKYNWLRQTYDTYQTATPWINKKTTNGLATALNLNAANILLRNMLDPFTTLPITIPDGELVLVCTQDLEYTAQQIQAATQLRTVPGGPSTNTNPMQISTGAPPRPFRIVVSQYLARVMAINSLPTTTWFWGSLRQAFKWIRALDITVSEALPGSHYMWSHDVVQAFKAGRIETAYTWQPRAVVESTVA